MRSSVAVTIAGQRYFLRTDAEESYVARLAEVVETKLRKVQRSTRQVSMQALAVLTALQLADEWQQERARRAELRRRVRERSRKMLELLDRGVLRAGEARST